MSVLTSFRAGRAYRSGDTNQVVPDAAQKGLVYLKEEDGLMHFYYKDLGSNDTEDLIIFPGDATFTHIPAARSYVLKFNSSNHRHFYWSQELDESDDAKRATDINALIGGTVEEEETDSGDAEMVVEGSTAPLVEESSRATATPAETSPDQLSSIQSILATFAAGRASGPAQAAQGSYSQESQLPAFTLPSVLPSSVILPLVSTLSPAARENLASFLPTALPPTAESLSTALASPEFRRSVASLDRALRTGALGPLVAGLGLSQDSAMGVEAFLEGIAKQAREIKEREDAKVAEEGDRMTE